MSNRAKRHTHKYHQIIIAGNKVWACALPDCNHYMPQHMANMMNGKATKCWQCGEDMTLHPLNMKLDRPICDSCSLGGSLDELPLSDAMRKFISTEKVD